MRGFAGDLPDYCDGLLSERKILVRRRKKKKLCAQRESNPGPLILRPATSPLEPHCLTITMLDYYHVYYCEDQAGLLCWITMKGVCWKSYVSGLLPGIIICTPPPLSICPRSHESSHRYLATFEKATRRISGQSGPLPLPTTIKVRLRPFGCKRSSGMSHVGKR